MKCTKSPSLPLTLAAILISLVAAANTEAQVTPIMDDDGIYLIHVDALGSWNAVTGPSHPTGPGNNLLHRDTQPGTSFSTFRIYNSDGSVNDYPLRSETPTLEQSSPLAPNQGWRTVWDIDGMNITQDVLIVGSTAANTAIYHTVEIRNMGRSRALVGWRNLHDWTVNDPDFDDGPSNSLEPRCGVPAQQRTHEFSRAPVTDQIVRVSVFPGTPTYQPLLALTYDPGYRADLPVTPPDEHAFVSWISAFGTAFDYVPTGQDVTAAGRGHDSAGLSWWGRDRARALEILPGASRRLTQVIFAQPPGGCLQPCLQFFGDRVLCAGDGSGDYVYDLTIRNRSLTEIHALQISGLPAGVTATLDPAPIFPIRPNHPRRFKIRFHNAGPGPLSFLITLFDAMGEVVCSVERTIELPACECAQLVRLRSPLCFPFRQPAPYSWELDLQNLFPGEVHHVVLTPQFPSDATFAPDVFSLSAPLTQGDTRRFRTKIGNVDAGEQVCFRISTHDSSFDDCCSIEQCVTIPRCTFDDITAYHPLGAATLDFLDEGILVGGFTSSGQDGVAIDLGGEAIGWDAEWLPIDLAGLPNGASLRQTAVGELDGQPDQAIVTLEAVNTGNGVELRTDFSALGTTTHTVAAFLDGDLMGMATDVPTAINLMPEIHTDAHYTFLGGIPAEFESIACDPDVVTSGRCILAGYTFKEPMPFLLPPFFEGLVDQIVIVPEQVEVDLGPLSALELRAGDIPSITLTSANTVEDCNGNGLSDYEDILSLESSDGDRDGIPDECTPSCSAPTNLCVNQERFRIDISWRDFAGRSGAGNAETLTGETGYFWFFDPDNVEVVVKVLEGCGFNDHFWVFAAGLTNVEVVMTVTDTVTGEVKVYSNPLGQAFQPIQDTGAFSCSAAAQAPVTSSAAAGDFARAAMADLKQTLDAGAGDRSSARKTMPLALNGGRFQAEARWRIPNGTSGDSELVTLTDDTGYFTFFSPDNIEVVLKVLDGCGFNNHFWVFAAGLTNVEVELTVTDTVTGQEAMYVNPQGVAFQPIQDTTAFAVCP